MILINTVHRGHFFLNYWRDDFFPEYIFIQLGIKKQQWFFHCCFYNSARRQVLLCVYLLIILVVPEFLPETT